MDHLGLPHVDGEPIKLTTAFHTSQMQTLIMLWSMTGTRWHRPLHWARSKYVCACFLLLIVLSVGILGRRWILDFLDVTINMISTCHSFIFLWSSNCFIHFVFPFSFLQYSIRGYKMLNVDRLILSTRNKVTLKRLSRFKKYGNN